MARRNTALAALGLLTLSIALVACSGTASPGATSGVAGETSVALPSESGSAAGETAGDTAGSSGQTAAEVKACEAIQTWSDEMRALTTIDPQAPEAWQLMHRAFDQAAGQVTRIGTLPALFDARPELAVQRASIERFYAQSAQRFVGAQSVAEPVALRSLARTLRRIERRHEP